MSAKNDYTLQWAIWAFDFYSKTWNDFQEDNSEIISIATLKIQSKFMEHLRQKLTPGLKVSVLTDETMSTQVLRNTTASLTTNAPQMYRRELMDISTIPNIGNVLGIPTHQCNICGGIFTGLMSLRGHMDTHAPLRPTGRPERSKSPEQLLVSGLADVQEDCDLRASQSQGQVERSNSSVSASSHGLNNTGRPALHTQVHEEKGRIKNKILTKTAETGVQSTSRNSVESRTKKTHECPYCDKKFAWRENLLVHKRIHTGIKPYKCNLCNKCFKQSGELTMHLRVHTGEKPYSCSDCTSSFTTSGNLTRHRRIHSGQKLYKCDVCKKAFTRNSSLKTHQQVHTGKKSYKCSH